MWQVIDDEQLAMFEIPGADYLTALPIHGFFRIMGLYDEWIAVWRASSWARDGGIVSRLDAIAEALNVSTDRAKRFTREVREHFEEAPSYAQILVAIRRFDVRPSVGQVVAVLKKELAAQMAAQRSISRKRSREPQSRVGGASGGRRGRTVHPSRATPLQRSGPRALRRGGAPPPKPQRRRTDG